MRLAPAERWFRAPVGESSRTARLCGAVLIAAVVAGCWSRDPVRPNIVLVSLDTLRADHLGAYGYERDTSPHVDALAHESVLFERAIAQAPSTLPSHRSLFHSRIPSHGIEAAPALGDVLRSAGYRTAAFTGGGNISARFGFGQGFEAYDESDTGFTNIFDEVETWIREHRDETFFLFLHTYSAHLPYDPPPPFDTLFLPNYQGAIRGKDTGELLPKIRRLRKHRSFEGKIELSEADKAKIISLYDGDVRHTDQYVGRLVDLLRETGLWDRTIFVLLSDHGEEFWDHGSVLHAHTVYEELVHVPLLVRLPGGERAGERIAAPVRLLDVAPTLYELAGAPTPPLAQGTSLVPLIRGETQEAPPAMAQSSTHSAWLEYPWKLIQARPEKGEPWSMSLYDLATDPRETTDAAAANPRIASRLQQGLERGVISGSNVRVRAVEPERADPELRRKLEALGYLEQLEDEGARGTGEQAPNGEDSAPTHP